MLTTITSVWGREETFRVWVKSVAASTVSGLKHFVFFVGEPIPDWVIKEYGLNTSFLFIQNNDIPGHFSIGRYHNQGAKMASTEWMMKLDVDAIPNTRYFKELIPILITAPPRAWFNGGMLLLDRWVSERLLTGGPLSEDVYRNVMDDRLTVASPPYPVSTNFICRRRDFIDLGGCLDNFRGWGWEDYQEVHMLERYYRQCDPLDGEVNLSNVTSRCRDEISRPRAKQLWMRNPWLCLLHRWHERNREYRGHSADNRELLLHYVLANKHVYEGRPTSTK